MEAEDVEEELLEEYYVVAEFPEEWEHKKVDIANIKILVLCSKLPPLI
jgi:hypothetical protein